MPLDHRATVPNGRTLTLIVASLSAIGPFAIDTYLPAFDAIAQDLHATDLQMQQTLSSYMLAFGAMMLWHGALSDALGRRPMLLTGLAVFAMASAGAALSGSIEQLWGWRALQGVAAGVGMTVGRAVVRDVTSGAESQRVLAQAMVAFSIAPAIAPIIGGFISAVASWRGIFWLLAAIASAIFALIWFALPETLAPERRTSLHPLHLLQGYRQVASMPSFWRLSGALTCNFLAFFIYVLSAPVFLPNVLGLASTQFGWLFIPITIGVMAGGLLSSRLAGRLSLNRTIIVGYAVMLCAAVSNLALNTQGQTSVATTVAPLCIYTAGMGLALSSLQVRVLELLPGRLGLTSSCQAFTQNVFNALAAALLVPRIWISGAWMAGAMLALLCVGSGLYARQRSRDRHAAIASQ